MKTCVRILIAITLTTTAAFSQTTILWNESVNGELSQDYSTATSLGILNIGTNVIIGETENEPVSGGWLSYSDYFTFIVPNGYDVTGLYIQIDKPNVWAWIGDAGFSSTLAFSGGPSTGDLLSQMGLDNISSGTFGMYLSNSDAEPYTSIAHYELDFVVEAVPEPGTFGLLLLGAGVFTLRHCRKSNLLS